MVRQKCSGIRRSYLAALLYRKKKIIHGDIVFVVKSEILADPVENIIINSISTIVLDYIDVTQRLQKYLQNASDQIGRASCRERVYVLV